MIKPLWVRRDVAIAIHERVLADYGGQSGIRDTGLLESALARPQQIHAYDDPDLATLAAAYASGIIRNHPFVDGQARIREDRCHGGQIGLHNRLRHAHGWR